MRIEHYLLPARDGYPLGVTAYRPLRPRYSLLLNGATGVLKRVYTSFAEYAASRGAWVFSYDYRGIGASQASDWQGAAPCMADWGALDQASLIDHMPDDLPLGLLGHSVGGQLPGLADNADQIQALLGVAAQSGYWRLWPTERQLRLALNWYAIVPIATRLLGSCPAGRSAESRCRAESPSSGRVGAARRPLSVRRTADPCAHISPSCEPRRAFLRSATTRRLPRCAR